MRFSCRLATPSLLVFAFAALASSPLLAADNPPPAQDQSQNQSQPAAPAKPVTHHKAHRAVVHHDSPNTPAPSSNANSQGGPSAPPILVNAMPANVEEFRTLLEGHQLSELRTAYNSTYGASLLFQTESLTYYVALFHGKEFLRVLRTTDYDAAQTIFQSFSDQTLQLGRIDIDTLRLQATKQYTERMVAQNQKQLQKLQADAAYQQQQAQQVAVAQQQASQQSTELSTDVRQTSTQLEQLRSQIRSLQEQQANPTIALPAINAPMPAPSSTAAQPASP